MTTEKPRSRADEFREAGLCECGCGLAASQETDRYSSGNLSGLPLGTQYSTGHNFKGSPPFSRERLLANLATPATQESDSAWLKRQVRELTGLTVEPYEMAGVIWIGSPGLSNSGFAAEYSCVTKRDVGALRRFLQERRWPLLGVNTTATSDGPLTEEERRSPAGVEMSDEYEPPRCFSCDAPVKPGCTACDYCIRRVSTNMNDDVLSQKTAEHTSNSAARARLAALEKRERRLNPVTATQRSLSLPHPWSNAEDFEP